MLNQLPLAPSLHNRYIDHRICSRRFISLWWYLLGAKGKEIAKPYLLENAGNVVYSTLHKQPALRKISVGMAIIDFAAEATDHVIRSKLRRHN